MTKKLMIRLLGAFGCAITMFAEEITAEQAKTAVANWTSRSSRKLFGRVKGVAPLVDEASGAKMHVVRLEGGGYVVTTADNRVSPIVAYSETDDFPTDPENPLVQILMNDATAIQQVLYNVASNNLTKSSSSVRLMASAASTDEFASARDEWAELLGTKTTHSTKRLLFSSSSAFSDVNIYVSPMLKTKWGQTTHNNSSEGLPCYNYYTPTIDDPCVRKTLIDEVVNWWDSELLETNETSRVPCGCVATAAAQLMYKWKYPSKYSYSKMKIVPSKLLGSSPEDSARVRSAIGEITYDIANSCNPDWGTIRAGGTGIDSSVMVDKLRTKFGYSSSTWVLSPNMSQPSSGLSEFNSLVVPNLIAKQPVILSIRNSKGGHCVVIDGLEMSGTTCKLHINLGWNGSYNNWYLPPNIKAGGHSYTSVRGIGVNIMPHNSGAIIAGIVVDDDSMPVSQAKVTVDGTTHYTDSHGLYSFVVSSGTYTVTAERDTISNTATATVKYSTGSDIRNAFVPIRLSANTRTAAPSITHSFDSNGQAVVTITADNDAVITYTMDGSMPTDDTIESIPYSEPFVLNGAGFRLIRARAFKEGFADSLTTDYRVPFPASTVNGKFSSAKCVTTSAGALLLDNSTATMESGEPMHSVVGDEGGASVWASFVVPTDGDYTFTAKGVSSGTGVKGEADDEEDSPLDTQLAVYTGDKLSGLRLVAANDDVDAAEFDFSSRVAFRAVKGTIYRIAVDTQHGAKGTIQLEWKEGREDVASPVDYDVFYDGEAKAHNIQIRSTADWFVVDCSDWIEITKGTGHDGEPIEFLTPELSADTYRTGTILVQAGEGSYSTIKITQSPAKWYTDKDEAFEAAQILGKRVFMVCGRDSCPNTTYVRLTACESDVAKSILSSEYVLWYCDCDKQGSDYYDYADGLGSYTLPLICIVNPESRSKYVGRRTGFTSADELAEFLTSHSEGTLPSMPPSVMTSNDVSGVLFKWGNARRAQTYEVWRGEQWNPGVSECIGDMIADTEFFDTSVVSGILYYYRVRAVNAVGAGEFSQAVVGCCRNSGSDKISLAIGDALGAPHLDWTTEGDYPWTVQGTNTYDGVAALQSAFVDPKQSGVTSVLKTTVVGPARMSFRYITRMYSSRFVVKIDGLDAFWATDAVPDWTLGVVEIPEGQHEIEFSYAKSGYYTAGFNGVYLDQVQFDVVSDPPALSPATTDSEESALAFTGTMAVSIDAPEGSAIYYTLDGSEPTLASQRYEGPFTLTASTRVRAICVQDGYDCSATVSGLYLERHPVQAGEWTTDVEGAKKAALKNGSIIVTLLANYDTCYYSQLFKEVSESAEFLSWARANGVYLITADSSRAVDAETAYNRFWYLFYDAEQSGSAYYPALAIANAWEPEKATGYAVARSGKNIGTVVYDGTSTTLKSGLQSFFAARPSNSYVWVEFAGNGGTPYEKSFAGILGQPVGKLPSAYRAYHYFDGWFTAADGGVSVSDDTILNGDVVYYAHWTPYSYRIRFDANGGSVAPVDKYIYYGAEYGDLPIPVRTENGKEYTFDGWFTEASGGTRVTSDMKVAITASQTLYAHWVERIMTYPITYAPGVNGSGNRSTDTKAHDVVLSLNGVMFVRDGYTQTGWATIDGGSMVYALGDSYTTNAAITLYPYWTANKYTVTFDANVGDGGWSRQMDFGSTITAPVVTHIGHTFAGWSPEVVETVPASNVTYVAMWTVNQYIVTFDASGGDGGWSRQMEYGTDLVAPTVRREGYSFVGWIPAVSGTVPVGGATYRARWEARKLTVTLLLNGGDGEGSTVVAYGMHVRDIALPTRIGYTFAGWFTAAESGEPVTGETLITDNISLYALWRANGYKVAFDANGGEGEMPDQAFVYGVEQSLSDIAFSAKDSRFTGWTLEKGGTVVYGDGEIVSNLTETADGTVTLYAVWENWNDSMQICEDVFGKAGSVSLDENDNIVVTLTNDVSGTVEIPDNMGAVTIDFNGHDMTGDEGPAIKIVKGDDEGAVTRITIVDTSNGERGRITGGGESAGIEIAEDAALRVRLDVKNDVGVFNGDGSEQDWRALSPVEFTLTAGEYFKATLAELGYDVPTDGTAYNVVAKGLPAGLKLVSNKAVTKKVQKNGKTTTVVVKAAKSEWWIEGVPTAALDFFTNPPYLVVTMNGETTTEALPVEVAAQEIVDLGELELGHSINTNGWLSGVGAGWTVSGLPTGLKYATKKVTKKVKSGKKTVTQTVAEAYAVYGKTTKAGLFTITAKKKKGAYYETMKYRVLVRPKTIDTAVFGESLTNITTMAYVPIEWDLSGGARVVATGTGEDAAATSAALPVVSNAVKVAGLPGGVTFAAKNTYAYKNAKNKTGKYLKQTGQTIVGKPTKPGTYVVTFTKNVTTGTGKKKKTVAKTAQILWTVVANDAELELGFNTAGGVVESGVMGLRYGELLAFSATSNATVTASGLPTGIKLARLEGGKDGRLGDRALSDCVTYAFTGFTTKAGTYLVTVKASLNGKAVTQRLALVVEGLPAFAQGTFNGWTYAQVEDGGAVAVRKATVSVTGAGKITAKVGTLSFAQTGWTVGEDGFYRATLSKTRTVGTGKKAKKYKDVLTLVLDPEKSWMEDQLAGSVATYLTTDLNTPVNTDTAVSARHNPFGDKNNAEAHEVAAQLASLGTQSYTDETGLTWKLKVSTSGVATISRTVGTGKKKKTVSATAVVEVGTVDEEAPAAGCRAVARFAVDGKVIEVPLWRGVTEP